MGQPDHFAQALRLVRRARQLTQEDFSLASSRTYVSMLERGERSPTLSKIGELSEVLAVHPLTLMSLAYCSPATPNELNKLLERIRREALAVMGAE